MQYDGEDYRFPVKNYLYPHNPLIPGRVRPHGCAPWYLVREGSGVIRHKETQDWLLSARDQDHQNTRQLVQWSKPDALGTEYLYPGHVKSVDYNHLPRFLKFKDAGLDAFEELRNKGSSAILKQYLKNSGKKVVGAYHVGTFQSLEQIQNFMIDKCKYMKWGKEQVDEALKIANVFKKDEELGRQMLCGPNPIQIKLVTNLSSRWEGGKEKVPSYALEGKSLDAAVGEGRVYEIITDDLIGVPHGGRASEKLTGKKHLWYTILSDCLFYSGSDCSLRPFLIRTENRVDGEEESFWIPPPPETPEEDPAHLPWLLAKMYFRCADLQEYSLCTHYSRGHAVNEVFSVSAYRNLPTAHPLFRLLQPHIQGIVPVNVQARGVLINPRKNSFALFLSSGDNLRIVLDNFFR